MTRHALKIALMTALALLMAIPATAGTDKIISFAPPGGIETQPAAINASATVVGRYQDNNGDGISPGFIRDASGIFTALYVPIAGTTETTATWINDTGQITGWYSDGKFSFHGFLRDKVGNYTSFDPLGSTRTVPQTINSGGEISGVYSTSFTSGFLRDATGNFATFGGPGSCGDSVVNAVLSASGQIAGTCYYNGGTFTYFIRTGDGILTEYSDSFGGAVISVSAISDQDVLTGYYEDAVGLIHGFWRDSSGLHPFDYPDSSLTAPTGINFSGTITGYYENEDGTRHGFVRDPLGNFTSFDAPNAETKAGRGTTPVAINRSGQITGQFDGRYDIVHGFLHK
jgi:hypothetical protein